MDNQYYTNLDHWLDCLLFEETPEGRLIFKPTWDEFLEEQARKESCNVDQGR